MGAPPLVGEEPAGGLMEVRGWPGPTITGPIPVGSHPQATGVVLGLGDTSGSGEIAGTDWAVVPELEEDVLADGVAAGAPPLVGASTGGCTPVVD